MESFLEYLDYIPDLTQEQLWIIVAILVLSLILLARIIGRRKGKKNGCLGFLVFIFATALLIFGLMAWRGIRDGDSSYIEDTEVFEETGLEE